VSFGSVELADRSTCVPSGTPSMPIDSSEPLGDTLSAVTVGASGGEFAT